MVDNNNNYQAFLETNFIQLAMELVEWTEQEMIEMNKSSNNHATPSEIKLFNALRGEDKSISDLARIMGISRQAVHKTTHRLEELGYLKLISRAGNKKDRIVCITNQGQEVREDGVACLMEIEEKLSWSIGERNLEYMKLMLAAHSKKIKKDN